ncbi:MAG: ABC transporter substrate-binding protein, partial [Alphaproteobacteria bacterium]
MTPISRSIFRSRPILRSVRSAMIAGSAALALAAASAGAAWAAGTLRIGMTASDIPLTTGQTDQGGEGQRVMGYTLYNALIEWDLSSADKAATLIPSLATSWDIDPTDQTKWTFKLRDGVKFHDGSRFDANAVVWNLDKLLKSDAPQFDKRQSAQGKSRIPAVASYKVIDPLTVEIVTKT